jgi:hypothetical protein
VNSSSPKTKTNGWLSLFQIKGKVPINSGLTSKIKVPLTPYTTTFVPALYEPHPSTRARAYKLAIDWVKIRSADTSLRYGKRTIGNWKLPSDQVRYDLEWKWFEEEGIVGHLMFSGTIDFRYEDWDQSSLKENFVGKDLDQLHLVIGWRSGIFTSMVSTNRKHQSIVTFKHHLWAHDDLEV